jgi:limonene-1,2-epoxide hydrolase
MPTPTETVAECLALSGRAGGMVRAIRDYFTPDTVWEAVGLSKARGPEAAKGVLAGLGLDPDSLVMRVDTLAIAAQGNKVLTEPIDHVIDGEGRSFMVFPLMGIFEVKDGKIATWRDHFDSATLSAQPWA